MNRRTAPSWFPGYAGEVNSPPDFAKCGTERRFAILQSLAHLMATSSARLNRADERLAYAAGAVARVEQEIASDRAFLADMMAYYIDYSQVFAAEAAQAISPAVSPASPDVGAHSSRAVETDAGLGDGL